MLSMKNVHGETKCMSSYKALQFILNQEENCHFLSHGIPREFLMPFIIVVSFRFMCKIMSVG